MHLIEIDKLPKIDFNLKVLLLHVSLEIEIIKKYRLKDIRNMKKNSCCLHIYNYFIHDNGIHNYCIYKVFLYREFFNILIRLFSILFSGNNMTANSCLKLFVPDIFSGVFIYYVVICI